MPMSRALTDSLTYAYAMYENLYFQNKIFLFYNSTPWTVSEKSLYSKVMYILWVNNFLGSHRRRCTPSDTFTNFYRRIHMSNQEYKLFTRLRCCYYPTHNFKPCDSKMSSLFQSPPFKQQTQCSFMSCTHARFT